MDSFELAPFRTISDFVTDAVFSSPAVGETARWYNRVKQNLLYYQTNYFVIILTSVLLYRWVNLSFLKVFKPPDFLIIPGIPISNHRIMSVVKVLHA